MVTQTKIVPTPEVAEAEGDFQAGEVLTIVSGHFTHDTFTAFLSPLQPLIIEKLSLSLFQAGSLASFLALPAVLNPFIGYLADRVSLRYFVILAPAVTATLMGSIGLAPSYLALALMLLVSGVSAAAFHAPAPAMISRISGKQLGKGMSWFMAAGELGRTVGPLLAVWAVFTWTLEGSFRIVALGWATSLLLYWQLRRIPARPEQERQSLRGMLPAASRLFPPLLVIVFFYGFVQSALSAYLPIFMVAEGASLWVAGASLSIWELAGVGGALVSGPLSDRLGRKPVLLVGLASSSVLMLIFLRVSGWLLLPVLIGLGFAVLSVVPVMLAMVQEQMPDHRAVANGLFIAISFVMRSVTILAVGAIGDTLGLRPAFILSAFGPLVAIPAVLWLPKFDGKTSGV
jgi:FSR family fosmidomycin resistance protein-like MFS transporter